ncbi:MAG: hypothetical protein ACT4PM_03290 [Gemmatimonadales bacterium]
MRRVALLLVGLAAVPVAVQAQMCVGQAAWSAGALKIGGALQLDGGTSLSGGVGVGKDGGLFGGAALGFTDYEGGGGSQLFVSAVGGKEISQKLGDKVSLCPIVGFQYGFEKDGFSYILATGGLSGGYPVSSGSSSLNIVLTGAAQLGFQRSTFEVLDESESETDVVLLLDAGVGLIFSNRISAVPAIRFIIGGPDGGDDVAFIARVNVAIGK